MYGWSANQIVVYEGTQKLVAPWTRCTENEGDYVEKMTELYWLL
jgi:hypothetical protein